MLLGVDFLETSGVLAPHACPCPRSPKGMKGEEQHGPALSLCPKAGAPQLLAWPVCTSRWTHLETKALIPPRPPWHM